MLGFRIDDGLSYHGIAVRLNREKISTRSGKPRWAANTVRKILESHHVRGYFRAGSVVDPDDPKGKRRIGGEWVKGKHEPIATAEEFARVEAMMSRYVKFAPSRPGRRPPRHLFVGGHLRCDYCGAAMQARTGPTPDADRYVCATWRDVGPDRCPTGWHRRSDVDSRFLSIFEREWLDYEKTRDLVAAELTRVLADAEAQAATADAEVAKVEGRRAKLDEDYFSEALGAAAYERLTGRLEEDLAGAVAERDRLARRVVEVREARANVDAESETLRRLTALRDTVARQARGKVEQQDLAALRGIVAMALPEVRLSASGGLVGLEPGTSMYLSTMAQQIHEGERYAIRLPVGGTRDDDAERIGNDGSRTL